MIKKVIGINLQIILIVLFLLSQNIFAISSDFDEVYISNFLDNFDFYNLAFLIIDFQENLKYKLHQNQKI